MKRLATALVLSGCVGQIGDRPSGTGPAGSADEELVAFVPLRRLTREEYNHTVRDLLGDTTSIANGFANDEAVSGFESNNVAPVTDLIVRQYLDAAEVLAAAAISRLDAIAPCEGGQATEECARIFIETFGRRAFRRPISESEVALLYALYDDKAARSGYAGGIQLVIEAILQSPRFLYRLETPPAEPDSLRLLSGYEVATRLSYLLWTSTPDDELLDAAESGSLEMVEGIEAQASRLLADWRAEDAIRSFHRQWLGLRELATAQKDESLFPEFTSETRAAMVEETLRFAAHAVEQGGDTLETLLTSTETFVDPALASIYGLPPPAADFELVWLPPEQRSGVLTQASLLSLYSSPDQTSPILRGKFVREKLLCQQIAPPPADVDTTRPELDPTLTTKERFEQHRSDPTCAACHELMDPIGFAFEHYDAIGKWRTMDGEQPVDATGELSQTADIDGPVDGALELGERLAGSAEVRDCYAQQWVRFALGRGERAAESQALAQIQGRFAGDARDVRELLVVLAVSDVMRFIRSEAGGAP